MSEIEALQAKIQKLEAKEEARVIDDAFERHLEAATKKAGVRLKEGAAELIKPYVAPAMINGEVRAPAEEWTPLPEYLCKILKSEFRVYVDRDGGSGKSSSSYDPSSYVPGRATKEETQQLKEWLQSQGR